MELRARGTDEGGQPCNIVRSIRSLWLRLRLPGIAADGFDHVVGPVLAASGPEAVGHGLHRARTLWFQKFWRLDSGRMMGDPETWPDDHVRVNVGSRGPYSSAKALTPVVTTTTYCLPFG